MERRDRSLKALLELTYIDSLDDEERAASLLAWGDRYITEETFDLTIDEIVRLSELFYKNIEFLKKHQLVVQEELDKYAKIKKFLLQ